MAEREGFGHFQRPRNFSIENQFSSEGFLTDSDRLSSPYQAIKLSINIDQVVIIDDIITTGATLSEATRVLKKAGVRNIVSLVFAHPIS